MELLIFLNHFLSYDKPHLVPYCESLLMHRLLKIRNATVYLHMESKVIIPLTVYCLSLVCFAKQCASGQHTIWYSKSFFPQTS